MSTWEVIFVGRKIGAIGIMHALPRIRVEADSSEQAIELAREKAYEEYEHVLCHRAEQVKP